MDSASVKRTTDELTPGDVPPSKPKAGYARRGGRSDGTVGMLLLG